MRSATPSPPVQRYTSTGSDPSDPKPFNYDAAAAAARVPPLLSSTRGSTRRPSADVCEPAAARRVSLSRDLSDKDSEISAWGTHPHWRESWTTEARSTYVQELRYLVRPWSNQQTRPTYDCPNCLGRFALPCLNLLLAHLSIRSLTLAALATLLTLIYH